MKDEVVAVFIVVLMLASSLSIPFVIKPTFAAGGGSNSQASDLGNETPALMNVTTDSAQTTGYNWDKWNFSDVNAWSKYSSTDGNVSRLIIGVNTEDPASLDKLDNAVIRYRARTVDKVAMEGSINAVVVELPLSYVPSFEEEVRTTGMASYVEPSMKVQATFTPNDPNWSAQWGPQMIQADWAWNTTVGSQDILVAVVDTGIDYDHPDLAANYVPIGFNWVSMNSDPRDDFGHGTHCAGIIAGVLNNDIGIAGVAQVHIMAEKVLDSGGGGYWDWVANGIINATDCGAKIISMSLGGYGESQLLHDAVKYAYDRGVLLVAAAANDDTNTKSYPAAYEEVVSVAATDQYDNKAWFSNWGDWIELAAPGVGILSTMPTYSVTLNYEGYPMEYAYLDGTSMACPHAAGVAALVWSLYPSKTRDWVRLWLRETANDLGDPGFDVIYGYGRVNARNAVERQPPTHDLIASGLIAPRYVLPGTVAMINATVLNFGQDTESDIDVQLLVDNVVMDSVVVGSLDGGHSAAVSLQWAPTTEGSYNMTFYVVPKPGEVSPQNNFLSKFVYVGYAVKAVVLRSSGNVDGRVVENWEVLSNDWQLFGGTLIDIDYTTLNKPAITFEDLVATGADVLIISCAYDAYSGWEFGDSEIEAITQYVHEGHGLIVTAGTLYDGVPNNKKLAPLLGINEAVSWTSTATDLLQLANLTHPLFAKVPNPLVFPAVGNAVSSDGRWDSNELAGGKYLARGHNLESSIVTFRGLVYISPWLEIIPSYYQHHLQLLYNAIVWSRYEKPQHDLEVSLQCPFHIRPDTPTIVNATVKNEGVNSETNVELDLFVDGANVAMLTGQDLSIGESVTLSYPWTPSQGTYNVTAYSSPILGEVDTFNNVRTTFLSVTNIPVVGFIETHGETLHSDDIKTYYTSLGYLVGTIRSTLTPDLLADYDVLVVGEDWSNVPWAASETQAVEDFIHAGKGFVGIGDELGFSVQDILRVYGITYTGLYAYYGPSSNFDHSHPIMENVNQIYSSNAVNTLYVASPAYWIASDLSNTYTLIAGAEVVGEVLCLSDDFAVDIYSYDNRIMLGNIIVWMAVKQPHDLVARLEAPGSLESNSAATLNATVSNRGINSETDVNLCLYIDSAVVGSAVIPTLEAGHSHTISYDWTPQTPKIYNITAYVQPVAEEERTSNNIKTIECFVFFYTRWYVAHEWDGGGSPMGWQADDGSWEYDLPFEFPFYGGIYQKIYVSSNGLITFNGPDASYSHSLSALSQKLAIAVAWMDWVTYYPCDIYTWANSSCVTIRWFAQALGSGVPANFEAILDARGMIRLDYGDCGGSVYPTVGISNGIDHMIAEDVSNINNINTILFIPFQIEHDVAVTNVDASATEAKEGSTVDVTIVAKNQGLFEETFNVTAYAVSTNSTSIYFDPSSCTFDASTVTVGDRFNVTVLVRNVEDLSSWQVHMFYDGNIINVTRWFEPIWDPQYVFYGESTLVFQMLDNYPPYPASAEVGGLLLPWPPQQSSFYGSGKLCVFEFEILALPPAGQQYSCALSIDNEDTYYMDSGVESFSIFYDVYNNGYYWCGNGQAPPPPPSTKYPIGTAEIVDLGPGESRSVVLPWKILDVPPHNYTLWAEADMVPGEIDMSNNICHGGTLKVIPSSPPVAVFTYSPWPIVENQPVTFDASNSSAPDSYITNYEWDFGDGNVIATTAPTVTHTYVSRGAYNVTLTITSFDGMTNSTSEHVDVWRHDVAVTDVRPCAPWAYEESIVRVNVTMTNLGDFGETVSLSLYYNITDNSKVGTELVALLAGETKTVTVPWNTTGAQVGYNYTLAATASIPVESNVTNNMMETSITIRIRIFGDVNDDGRVDIKDVSAVAKAFGSVSAGARWNPDCDINGDGRVDIKDIASVARHFGRTA